MPEARELVSEEKWTITKGTKINRLTLKGPVEHIKNSLGRRIQWGMFACECGGEKFADLSQVKCKHVKSCDCLIIECPTTRKGTLAKDGYKLCANIKCRAGRILQPINNFTKCESAPDNLLCWCRLCNKIKKYESKYKRPYEEFERQIASQDGMCDFCGKALDANQYNLSPVQDHNHITNKTRGVVHHRCNILIAFFEPPVGLFSPNSFSVASYYVDKWNGRHQTKEQERCLAN